MEDHIHSQNEQQQRILQAIRRLSTVALSGHILGAEHLADLDAIIERMEAPAQAPARRPWAFVAESVSSLKATEELSLGLSEPDVEDEADLHSLMARMEAPKPPVALLDVDNLADAHSVFVHVEAFKAPLLTLADVVCNPAPVYAIWCFADHAKVGDEHDCCERHPLSAASRAFNHFADNLLACYLEDVIAKDAHRTVLAQRRWEQRQQDNNCASAAWRNKRCRSSSSSSASRVVACRHAGA